MRRHLITFACVLLSSAACEGQKDEAPQLENNKGRAEDANLPPLGTNPNTGSSTTVEEPVKTATLAGYPKDMSAEPVYKISVSEVPEYKWKVGIINDSSSDCSKQEGYSHYQSSSNPINLDISFLARSNVTIKLCVVGRNKQNKEQDVPTEASWLWTPPVPGAFEQLDFIDGDNQVKIVPKATNIQWLVVRSKVENIDKIPVDGTVYNINDRFGLGTVIASGTPAEIIDTVPKNLETYYYTVFSFNAARRYSSAIKKTMLLSRPSFAWYKRDLIQPGFVGLTAIPNSNRVICRVNHLANGRDYGWHPGRTQVLKNGDVKNTLCVYEYFSRTYTSSYFEALMVNKGDPMRFFRWERSSGGIEDGIPKTIIPLRVVDGGAEKTSDGRTIPMAICRGYSDAAGNNLEMVGKASADLPGCIGMINSDDTSLRTRGNLDILVEVAPQT